MTDTTAPRPKRPPRPRLRVNAQSSRTPQSGQFSPHRGELAHRTRRRTATEEITEYLAFDGTVHTSIRARRIYEGGIEYEEGLSAFINDYPITIVERSTKAFLTRLYNGAAEYLGWCLDTGRLPRVHTTLPPEDAPR